jgi:two-component system, NtrC family, response regulator AlgB
MQKTVEIDGGHHPARSMFLPADDRMHPSVFSEGYDLPLLATRSPRMKAFLNQARRAPLIAPAILLIGDTGVGKSVMARQIHRWSPRRDQPFVVVDCAALSESSFENQRFEQLLRKLSERASETGRPEPWETGTIFLDNLADLSLGCQAHLLTFIEAHKLLADPTDTGVRILAALNGKVALDPMQQQNLRNGLLFRIGALSLRIPPMCDRREDLLPMADYFLEIESNRNRRWRMRFSNGAARAIRNYSWPGNVRELHHVIERAVVTGDDELVTERDLPDITPAKFFASGALSTATTLRELERNHIARVLATSATVEQAAATLGINSSTLWRKRKLYKIE